MTSGYQLSRPERQVAAQETWLHSTCGGVNWGNQTSTTLQEETSITVQVAHDVIKSFMGPKRLVGLAEQMALNGWHGAKRDVR